MTEPAPPATPAPTVVVLGGGIAGLAAAWELVTQPGAARVVVLEGSDRPGGKIAAGEMGGRTVPLGPDAFVARRPEALELCRDLGLGDELVAPGARHAALWTDGRLRQLPPGLALGLPTRIGPLARSGILSAAGLGRVAADLATPPWKTSGVDGGDAAIGPLVAARLGREVVQKLADPLIGGIHAGSVETMSAAAVYPLLLEAAARAGSLARNLRPAVPAAGDSTPDAEDAAPVFLTLRRGLTDLVERLVQELTRRGVEIHPARPARALSHRSAGGWRVDTAKGAIDADAVVVALPAPAAAAVVRAPAPDLGHRLAAVSHASVALVTLRFAAGDVGQTLGGTGYLVPRAGDPLLTACTFLSVKWPALARPDDVLVRVSAGRHGDDRHAALDDDALVACATEELAPALGLTGAPLEWMVTRYPDAFPQYDVGHLERVEEIEQAASRAGNLAVAGAALRGVGLPACIASGRRAARLAVAGLGAARGS